MYFVVDTNVLVVANQQASHASPDCVIACVEKLREIQRQHVIVLDYDWILTEYKKNLHTRGQLGVGTEFLIWILTNQGESKHCEFLRITPNDENSFEEFPKDEALAGFDPADRKFVAVALAHPDKPPILNAVDSDWMIFRDKLAVHGVTVEFLCPEAMRKP